MDKISKQTLGTKDVRSMTTTLLRTSARVKEVLIVMCNDKSRRNRHSRWTVTVHRGTSGFWSRAPTFLRHCGHCSTFDCQYVVSIVPVPPGRYLFPVLVRVFVLRASDFFSDRLSSLVAGAHTTPGNSGSQRKPHDKKFLSAVPIFLPDWIINFTQFMHARTCLPSLLLCPRKT